MEDHRYICSSRIATAVHLAYQLRKPVLIEGPPGVGKTELAKTTADMFELPLIGSYHLDGAPVLLRNEPSTSPVRVRSAAERPARYEPPML